MKIPIFQYESQDVHNLEIKIGHLSETQAMSLMKITGSFKNLFADPDERVTYTTKVMGEISTITDQPVYTRSYPYPMALKNVVEEEEDKLLKDGIIRSARSPYNSPIWVVPKKWMHRERESIGL